MPVLFFSHPQNYDFLMRPNKEPNINQDLRKRSEDDRSFLTVLKRARRDVIAII